MQSLTISTATTNVELDNDFYDSATDTWLTDPTIMEHLDKICATIPGITEIEDGWFIMQDGNFILWPDVPMTTVTAIENAVKGLEEVALEYAGTVQAYSDQKGLDPRDAR